jgi:two-component system OmpR family response regulator
VEDDPDYRETTEALLAVNGHSVESVDSGLEALECMRTDCYDIVLLDWHLPQLEGGEVVRRFRAAGGATPVLMLTGEDSQTEQMLKCGANDWLRKPCDLQDLLSRIEKLLSS